MIDEFTIGEAFDAGRESGFEADSYRYQRMSALIDQIEDDHAMDLIDAWFDGYEEANELMCAIKCERCGAPAAEHTATSGYNATCVWREEAGF